jgi:hypothetical protein
MDSDLFPVSFSAKIYLILVKQPGKQPGKTRWPFSTKGKARCEYEINKIPR